MKKSCFILFLCFGLVLLGKPGFSDLGTGLVAYYPFNGNANDESGNGHDGIVTGATLTTDKSGNENSAYLFYGTNEKIEIDNTPSLQIGADSFSIATWIKTTQNAPWKRIVTKRSGEMSSNGNWFSLVSYYGKARFEIYASQQIDSTTSINDDTWHFIAVVRDKEAETISLYVDGNLENSMYDDGRDLSNPVKMEIGVWSTESQYYDGKSYQGAIDNVFIYDRSLSQFEIDQLYRGDIDSVMDDGIDSNGDMDSENIALGKLVTADTNSVLGAPKNITNGEKNDHWYSWESDQWEQRFVLDLGEVFTIRQIDMDVAQVYGVSLKSSEDGETYTERYTWSGSSYSGTLSAQADPSYPARYIEYYAWADSNMYVGLAEIEVYGVEDGDTDSNDIQWDAIIDTLSDDVQVNEYEMTFNEDELDYFLFPELWVGWNFPARMDNVIGTGEDIFEYSRLFVSDDTVQILDVRIGEKDFSLNLTLNFINDTVQYGISAMDEGWPEQQPESLLIPGVNFSEATADLIGPPLTLAIYKVVIGEDAYDLTFTFDGEVFMLSGITITPTELRDKPRLFQDRSASEEIDKYIQKSAKSHITLGSDADVQGTLSGLADAIISDLKLGSEMADKIKDIVMDNKEAYIEQISNGSIKPDTIVKTIGTNFLKRLTPAEYEKFINDYYDNNIPDHVQGIASAAGHTSEGAYKAAAGMIVGKLIETGFPKSTAAVKLVHQTMKRQFELIRDDQLSKCYNSYKLLGHTDATSCYSLSAKLREILENQGKPAGEAEYDEYLKNLFNEWDKKAAVEIPKRIEFLEKLKENYLELTDYQLKKLIKWTFWRPSEAELFEKYVAHFEAVYQDLRAETANCEEGGLTDDLLMANAKRLLYAKLFDTSGEVDRKRNYRNDKKVFLEAYGCIPKSLEKIINEASITNKLGAMSQSDLNGFLAIIGDTNVLNCLCSREAPMVFGGSWNGDNSPWACGGEGGCRSFGPLNCRDYSFSGGGDGFEECGVIEAVAEYVIQKKLQ